MVNSNKKFTLNLPAPLIGAGFFLRSVGYELLAILNHHKIVISNF